jgi:hypothetical protein
MSKLKEEWINNLTDEEIDEIYNELINADTFTYLEDNEQTTGEISGTTTSEG